MIVIGHSLEQLPTFVVKDRPENIKPCCVRHGLLKTFYADQQESIILGIAERDAVEWLSGFLRSTRLKRLCQVLEMPLVSTSLSCRGKRAYKTERRSEDSLAGKSWVVGGLIG